MGGSIRVITKLNNEIYKHTRWTNRLPEYVVSDKFIERDEKYINEYLEEYKNSYYKSDIELFSPCDYGLDVFDFDKKVIISNQMYCSYLQIDTAAISLYLNGVVITDSNSNNEDVPPQKTKRMYDKKQISLKRGWFDNESSNIEQPKTYEKAWELASKSTKKYKESLNFKVNWEDFGWKYIKFEESDNGFIEMLDYCIKNYHLSTEEIKDWIDYIKYKYEDDSEINFNDVEKKYINYYREHKLERIVK